MNEFVPKAPGMEFLLYQSYGGNPWIYLLIPHDQIAEQMSLSGLETVDELVERLATKSPRGIACMKEMVSNAMSMSYQDCLARESEMCIEHAGSYDAAEGITAFAEHRLPNFRRS